MPAEGIDRRCTTLPHSQLGPFRRSPIPTSRKTFSRSASGRSRLGQNFLIDRNAARRIVAAAALHSCDQVLEIGPGRGALTRLLVKQASRVVGVEVDPNLAAALKAKFPDTPAFTAVVRDALEYDPAEHFNCPFKLIANLPYYVATPIIRRFLTTSPRPSRMVVMVQREVADTMAAKTGRMGLLSVMVQLHASVKLLFGVPARAFRPQPKVSSAVVEIEPYERPAYHPDDPDSFIEFVAAGFRAPRKQLRNSLHVGLDSSITAITDALEAARIDGRRRPGTLGLSEWSELYTAWTSNESCPSQVC